MWTDTFRGILRKFAIIGFIIQFALFLLIMLWIVRMVRQ